MSTNITSLKIKTIHLELPLVFDFQAWLQQQDTSEAGVKWCIDDDEDTSLHPAKGTWELPLSGHSLSGTIQGNKLIATSIDCTSDGSAHIWGDVICPLFEQYGGTLEALVVWEDGSVYRSVTQDGVTEETEVEW